MDAKEFLKRIPTWLIAVVVLAFLVIFVERIYIANKPIQIFGREFGPVEETGRLPTGTIIKWDPTIRDLKGNPTGETRVVPKGWFVCDGTNGTPTLHGHAFRGLQDKSSTGGDLALRAQTGNGDSLPLKFVKDIKGEDDLAFYGVIFLCNFGE